MTFPLMSTWTRDLATPSPSWQPSAENWQPWGALFGNPALQPCQDGGTTTSR
jgi:hypothetical protein